MTTRVQLRTAVRKRLEDNFGANHLWDDAELDEHLRFAVRQYGTGNPIELSTSLAVTTSTATYTLPAAIPDGRDLVHVLDETGRAIEKDNAPAPTLSESPLGALVARTWRVWAQQLVFNQRPPASASYTLLYRTTRQLIEDDVTAQPIPSGEEPIIIQLAAAAAVMTRAIAEEKRGATRNAASMRRTADAWSEEAQLLARQGTRSVRGGTLQ